MDEFRYSAQFIDRVLDGWAWGQRLDAAPRGLGGTPRTGVRPRVRRRRRSGRPAAFASAEVRADIECAVGSLPPKDLGRRAVEVRMQHGDSVVGAAGRLGADYLEVEQAYERALHRMARFLNGG